MRRFLSILAAACTLAALLIAAPARGGTGIGIAVRPESGIRIDAELLFDQTPSTGFCPVHIKIQNRSKSAHTWTVRFSSAISGNRQISMAWQTELSVPGGQAGEWDLMIPRSTLDAQRSWFDMLSGSISGYGIEQDRFALPSHYPGGNPSGFVLISSKLSDYSWSRIEAEIRSYSSPFTNTGLTLSRFNSTTRAGGRVLHGSPIKLEALPPDWRALAGVSGFWMTGDEWSRLTSDQRRTVRQWILGGGRLFLATEREALEKLPLLPPKLTAQRIPLGFGSVQTVPVKGHELAAYDTAGQILELDANLFPAWDSDFGEWGQIGSLGWPHMNVPLIIAFVSLFAIVIGPVNLWLFAPPRRRHRLFFTVPLISVAASVFLFGVIAFGDGFGGTGYRNALVYLPAGENQAFVTQEQTARSRLLTRRDFKLPADVQLGFAQVSTDSKASLSFNRAGGDAGGDWFRSRAIQTHALRAIVPTRAEVVLQPGSSETPTLLSSVGAELRDVHYVDSAGQHWRTDMLPTGTPVALKKATEEEAREWIGRTTSEVSPHLAAAMEEVKERPGFFYAVADGFTEAPIQTLTSINWLKDSVICFGPVTTETK